MVESLPDSRGGVGGGDVQELKGSSVAPVAREEQQGQVAEEDMLGDLSPVHVALIVAFRLVQGALLRTYWTPDEFWQTHEVAHHMNFGCGHLTWEWQPEWMVRGPAHPMLFAGLYVFLEMFSLHTPNSVAAAPRVLQCLLAAVADRAVHRLAVRTVGRGAARWVLFCQLANWFNGYALLRPYANSLEAVLTVVVFAEIAGGSTFRSWLTWAAAACILRPTSAVVWVCPWVAAVAKDKRPLLRLCDTALIGSTAVAVAVCIDSAYYGTPTWSAVNFFRFNFLEGHSTLYGTHYAAWYLVEALPAMLGTMAPLLCFADWRRPGLVQVLAATASFTVAVYSLSAHKELRFLLPILPLLLVASGDGLWRMGLARPQLRRAVAAAIVASNAAAFVFLGLVHQRAPMACVERLRAELEAQPLGFSVDFLTTCHATPFTSHLHAGLRCVDIRFLDCSPRHIPGGGGLTREGTDSARLVEEGVAFVEDYYRRPGARRPRFVVVAEEVFANISAALPGYASVERFEHNIESSAALLLLRQG